MGQMKVHIVKFMGDIEQAKERATKNIRDGFDRSSHDASNSISGFRDRAHGSFNDVDNDNKRVHNSIRNESNRSVRDIDRNFGSLKQTLIGTNDTARDFFRIMRFPILASGLSLVTGSVARLGSSLISLASYAGVAAGALAAIPLAAGAIGQGVGVVAAAFTGIKEAVKAMDAAQLQGVRTAQTTANARRTAMEGVREATLSLKNAQLSAARSVQDAEISLSDAQRSATRAQDDLNLARKEAKERLEDLSISIKGAALDEEDAILAVERARQRLAEVKAPRASLEFREADLALRQAIQRLAEIREKNADLRREAAAAAKAGIEGDTGVVAAKEKVLDASRRVATEERQLRQVRVDAAARIAEAQKELSLAQEKVARTGQDASAAQIKLTQAMQKLSPAGKEFATFLHSNFIPALISMRNKAQEGFLPGFQEALVKLLDLTPLVNKTFLETGKIVADLTIRGAEMVTSGPWKRDFALVAEANERAIRRFGDATLILAPAFRDLAMAALPLLDRFSKWTVVAAEAITKFIEARKESGALAKFFDMAGDAAARLGRIAFNLIVTLWNVANAAFGAGNVLSGSIEGATKKWADWTSSLEGQNKLKKWFDDAIAPTKAAGELLNAVAGSLFRIAEDIDLTPIINQIRDQLLPAVERLVRNVSGDFLTSLISTISSLANVLGTLAAEGGPLNLFFKTLTLVLDTFDKLIELPIVGTFVSWVLAAAAVGGAIKVIAFVADGVVRSLGVLTGAIRLVFLIWNASLIIAARTAVTTAATTAGAWLVALGPIGLAIAGIIATIGLLVAAFIFAYKKSETFRDIVNGAFKAVSDKAKELWDKSVKPSFDKIIEILRKTGEEIEKLWNDYFEPYFRDEIEIVKELGETFLWWWHNVTEPTFKGVTLIIQTWYETTYKIFMVLTWYMRNVLGPVIFWIWKTVFAVAFAGITIIIKVWWFYVSTVFKEFVWYVKNILAPIVLWLWKNVIERYFGAMGRGIVVVWERVIRPIFEKVKVGVKAVGDAFRIAKDFIKRQWDTLSAILKKPIDIAINFINKQVIDRVNKFTSPFHLTIPKIAGGGEVRGPWQGPAADNVLARVNPKEYVHQVAATKYYGIPFMNAINQRMIPKDLLQSAIPGLAGGGRVFPLPAGSWRYVQGTAGHGYPAVDYAAAAGTPIRAALQGYASVVRFLTTSYGRHVALTHAGNWSTWYAHMKNIGVTEGQQVHAGDPIGSVDSTGNSTGNHLHFEVRRPDGLRVDPQAWLEGAAMTGGGNVFSSAIGLVRQLASKLAAAAFRPIKALANRIIGGKDGNFRGVLQNIVGQGLDKVVEWIRGKEDEVAATGAVGGNLGAWIQQAIKLTGVPGSWAGALARRAMFESGGNPKAINLTDSNARAGHPSKGLMQTIDSTFNAYKLPGMNDIWNPVHNLAAAIRYILARYGSISAIDPPVRGYADGLWQALSDQVAMIHRNEMIIPAGPAGQIRQSLTQGGDGAGIYVAPGAFNVNITIAGNVEDRHINEIKEVVHDELYDLLRELRTGGRR